MMCVNATGGSQRGLYLERQKREEQERSLQPFHL